MNFIKENDNIGCKQNTMKMQETIGNYQTDVT